MDEPVVKRDAAAPGAGGAYQWSIGQQKLAAIVALGALVLGMLIGGALNHHVTSSR